MENLLIVWRDVNATGVPILDEQHRGVVSMINSLFYFISHRQGMNILNSAVSTMQQYTVVHFATEEQVLEQMGYKDRDKHVRLHEALIHTLYDASKHSERMREPEAFLLFLKKWWLEHINTQDMEYVKYMRQNGIVL